MNNFKNFLNNRATVDDILKAWTENQLPEEVENSFRIDESCIRSLHQSNFELYKDGIVIEHFIEMSSRTVVVFKKGNEWIVTLYSKDKDRKSTYVSTTFCTEEDLKDVILDKVTTNIGMEIIEE